MSVSDFIRNTIMAILSEMDENKNYSLNGKVYSGRNLMRHGIFLFDNEVMIADILSKNLHTMC